MGAANRGATRNIARGPLFHPLKESWQGAQPAGRKCDGETGEAKDGDRGGGGGLAGYNGTKLL